jgi:dihydroxyacetone kinase-like predicted kinase
MKLQHEANVTAQAAPEAPKEMKPYAFVSVCAGEGITGVFKDLGIDEIVGGGQTMNPSTEDILNAVNAVPAKTVFVLPNNKNIILAAEQAAAICEKNLVVIPTKSTPQGIAAMQRFDENASVDENVEAMKEGAESADTIQITYAARNSEFDGLQISEGEYLALYENKLAGNGSDLDALLFSLAERAKSRDKEIITIYYGADVTEADAEAVMQVFSEVFDEDSVMLINGGQPVYYYIISAE